MKHYLPIVIVALTSIVANAQNIKFGKFSPEEITKKASTINPTAPAEVLYCSAQHKIDWDKGSGNLLKTSIVTYRIKVYDKDKTPDHILAVEIPLGKGASKADVEKLMSLKASTFVPEGSSMREIKVSKKDIFTKNAHDYLDIQTLTFPDVQNGSILEYSYEIVSPFYYNTETWYFQETIPVVKSILSLETNETLKYQEDSRGQYNVKPKHTTRKESTTVKQGGFDVNSYGYTKPSHATYEYELNKLEYTADNLPGYEREAYVLNPRNLLSSIRFELAAYSPKNGVPKYFSTTWDNIGRELIDSESFGRQISGNGFLDDKVKELIAGKNTSEEKLNSIYSFVRDNYKWNGYNGIYTDKGIRKTFNEKVGNVADINLMLVSMLEKAGFKANPIVLSTVQNGMLNYIFPSKAKLNYVIASVDLNGNDILMDATDINSQINLLPLRTLNFRGILIGKNNTKEIDLQNSIMSNDKEQIVATLSPDGKFTGTFNNYHDNYFYMNDRSQIQDDPKEFEKTFIKDYTFDIENFRSNDNNEGLIRHSFKFDNIQANVIGDKIMFNPMLFLATENHNLNYETRNYNLEFGTPMNISKSVKIKIPEGYKLESVPKIYNEKLINDAAGYAYNIVEKDGFLNIYSARVLPYSILPSDYYKPFKEFMNKIVEAETQQVILIKQ